MSARGLPGNPGGPVVSAQHSEEVGSGRNVVARVADSRFLSEQSKGRVKGIQDSVGDAESEALGGVVPHLVEIGFREWRQDVAARLPARGDEGRRR